MRGETFRYGDRVMLVTEGGHRYLFTIRERARFHTSEGYFESDEIAGKPSGCSITSNKGSRAIALKPLLIEELLALPRPTQITYPKDLGLILVSAGILPGSIVVEAGTGSGVLALFLTSYVKPGGIVYSYDLEDEYFPAVKRHAERLGLDDCLVLKKGDVTTIIPEKGVDAFVLDIPEPWKAVETAKMALKPGGSFVAIIPTLNQLEKTCEELRNRGFLEYFAGELIFRAWRVKGGMSRPHHIARGHTVFIAFARKTEAQELVGWRTRIPDGYR